MSQDFQQDSLPILLFAHVLHPRYRAAVELFLNRDVRHRRGGRGAVPVFFIRREPNDVAGANLFDRSAIAAPIRSRW